MRSPSNPYSVPTTGIRPSPKGECNRSERCPRRRLYEDLGPSDGSDDPFVFLDDFTAIRTMIEKGADDVED
jgi:hypothetical protein